MSVRETVKKRGGREIEKEREAEREREGVKLTNR